MPEEIIRQYLFDSPCLYRIRVVGELDVRWLAHLQGLEIATTSWSHYPLVTQISGWLADQTTLSGLLVGWGGALAWTRILSVNGVCPSGPVPKKVYPSVMTQVDW